MRPRFVAVLAPLLALLLPVATLAATPPASLVEGVQYETVEDPGNYRPVKPGQIEVVEIFAYTCPHCAHFAPQFEAWKAKQPKNVVVRYTPAAYDTTDTLSRGFFAAQRIGALQKTHMATFRALHDERVLPMDPTDDEMVTYYAALGVDATKFRAALDSKAVQDDMQAANAFSKRVLRKGTPELIIGGRWRILGNSFEEMLRNAAAVAAHPPAS
jgi:thiol:disulfide interchange protein DsbA